MGEYVLTTEQTETTAVADPAETEMHFSNLEAIGIVIAVGLGVLSGILCSKSLFSRLRG